MYRFGIMVDKLQLQAWQIHCLQQLLLSGLAEAVVIIFNEKPVAKKKASKFLYKVYRLLDRKFFKPHLDAFQVASIYTVLDTSIPILPIQAIQTTYRDEFSTNSLIEISSYKVDFILRFGFRILSGPILTLPKWGIWSFHHGNPEYYRGGPPAFWEVFEQKSSTGAVLMRLTEDLDQGYMLYESVTQTNPLSVDRNAQKIFWASSFFPVRVLKQLASNPFILDQNRLNGKIAPLKRDPGSRLMLYLFANHFYRTLKRKVNEWKHPAHWEIAYIPFTTKELEGITIIAPQNFIKNPFANSYLADPFPIKNKNQTWIFAECFDKKLKKGCIVVIDEQGNGSKVLEEKWHLSYPFLTSFENKSYMIPESSIAGKIYLYEAIQFPLQWKRIGIFIDREGFDPTLYQDERGFWLFVNQKPHEACSPFDELYLYFSPSLTNPSWESSPLNPIVSDVRRSRPAGRIFKHENQLIRPAQDSEFRYGHRIRLMEITNLSLEHYEEKEVGLIETQEPALGIHSFNVQDSNVWVDFYFRK